MQSELQDRLEKERQFQNARVVAEREGRYEQREGFYFLAQRAIDRYHDAFGPVAGKRVVVVGCNEGGVQIHARNGAREVIGIDIADEPVRVLNEELAEDGLADVARAVVMNGEALDFEPGSVDLICCSGVLHHLDVDKAARNWARVLSKDGKVVMIEPMKWNPAIAAYRMLTPNMRTDDEHPLTPKDIAVLERHFGRVDVEPFVLTTLASLPVAYLAPALRDLVLPRLERLDDALVRRFPGLGYLCWTAVIELYDPR